LVPPARQPEEYEIAQDKQRRSRFDYKAAEAFADVIGSQSGEDLVRAIKHRSNDGIPEPSSHKTKV
jgi:hypothetical protein